MLHAEIQGNVQLVQSSIQSVEDEILISCKLDQYL